ncbi:MAG: acetolactate synthase large subunit [Pseudomonadales bacterium]|nr:acetolactate synthase large subunit [Pseudomonadales bacterium]
MNGAESLVRTLLANGVDTCFANPGTSEIHLVQAIEAVEGFRGILCLFEGVCTGAADGYGRMRGHPAATLLHLGAGLGNGIANFHNCRRAGTPVVNVVGQHAIHHIPYDAPLTSDVEAVARPVSSFLRTSRSSRGLGDDAAGALLAAMAPNPDPLGSIATLIVPADCAWGPAGPVRRVDQWPSTPVVEDDVVISVASLLDPSSAILIDGSGLLEDGVRAAGRIAAGTGCGIYSPTFPARVEAGPDLPVIRRLPYFPESATQELTRFERVILAGATAPAAFFKYPGLRSEIIPESCSVHHLALRHEDVARALGDLADELEAPSSGAPAGHERPAMPEGRVTGSNFVGVLAHHLSENCILALDSGPGAGVYSAAQRMVRHSWLNLTGGSIGGAGPVALGASIASRDRSTFALMGDGAALYTLQYLWTAARENLDLTTIVFSNRQYNVLEVEYLRTGRTEVGRKSSEMFDLTDPDLDFVAMAAGLGVPGSTAETCEQFDHALHEAQETDGPYLIDLLI